MLINRSIAFLNSRLVAPEQQAARYVNHMIRMSPRIIASSATGPETGS
jgi:hypothetical protein